MKHLDQMPSYWVAQIIGWSIFSIVAFSERTLLFQSTSMAFILTCLSTPVMFALSHALVRVYNSIYLNDVSRARLSITLIVCSISAGLLSTLNTYVIFAIHDWSLLAATTLEHSEEFKVWLIPFAHNSLLYTSFSLTFFFIRSEINKQKHFERAARAETARLKVEFQKLRLQLNPHFLFNVLNGVIEEIPENPSIAIDVLHKLTAYLRYSLKSIDETIVTVQTEADEVHNYLSIQEARFGPRLVSTVVVSPDASNRSIVGFLLQPLVENGIKHGNLEATLHLHIEVNTFGSALKVEIINNGHLKQASKQDQNRTSVGLNNLRQRLSLHYPNRHEFSLAQLDDERVMASLTLEGDPCSEP